MNARQIDEMLGTPARLAIVATLAGTSSLAFTDLRQQTGLADGNLHVQTRKLLAAGYITAGKEQRGNRQVTCFGISDLGRERFREHVRQLAAAGGIGIGGQEAPAGRIRRRPGRDRDDSQVW